MSEYLHIIQDKIIKAGYCPIDEFQIETNYDERRFETITITCLGTGVSKIYSTTPPFTFQPISLSEILKDFSSEREIINIFKKPKIKIFKLAPIQNKLTNRQWRHYKNIPNCLYVVVSSLEKNESYEQRAQITAQRYMTIAIESTKSPVEFPWLDPILVTIESLDDANSEEFININKKFLQNKNIKCFESEKWIAIKNINSQDIVVH